MDTSSAEKLACSFDQPGLHALLESAADDSLDAMPFGVVRMTQTATVVFYSAFESVRSGLSQAGVVGRNFFTEVAPCMDNFMVSTRFETETELDAIIDYVLTLRMRPTPARLRLLRSRLHRHCYVLILRTSLARP